MELKLVDLPEPSGLGLACEHLDLPPEGEAWEGYGRYYTGDGTHYALVCPDCISTFRLSGQVPRLLPRSDEDLAIIEDELCDDVIGAPAFGKRLSNLAFSDVHFPCDFEVAAVAHDGLRWLGLSSQGELIDLCGNALLCRLDLGSISSDLPLDLYARSGYVVVVNRLGRCGRAYSQTDGRRVLNLDRGGYRPTVSRFPVALVQQNDRCLLIHASSWNQLHITDLETGKAVNNRQVGDRFDYFHASLSASPGGEWVISNGWVWHPMGWLRSWSLKDWLDSNPFEAEDGTSVRDLCQRNYYWDGPTCWLDETTLAVWGHGDDSLWLTPAVLFFDVRSGTQVGWFPGPQIRGGELPGATTSPKGQPGPWPGFLAFDKHLFAVSPDDGTTVWDISTGEQLLHSPALKPIASHAGEFLSLGDGSITLSRLIERTEPT